MLQRILNMPHRPVVIEIVVYRWLAVEERYRAFEAPYRYHGDDEIGALAQYYHLPWIATRSMMWDENNSKLEMPKHANYSDWMGDVDHPNVLGHRYIGDMINLYFTHVLDDLDRWPLNEIEEKKAAEPVHVLPMFANNYPNKDNTCMIDEKFQQTLVDTSNFSWMNEGTEESPKWGMIGNEVGAWMEIQLNTTANIDDTSSEYLNEEKKEENKTSILAVAMLRSYEHMGRFSVECVFGCACERMELDAHQEKKESQMDLHRMQVSRVSECRLRFTIIEGTTSGEHKVKILGVILTHVDRDPLLKGVLE